MWVLSNGQMRPFGGMTKKDQYREEDVPMYNKADRAKYIAAARASQMD